MSYGVDILRGKTLYAGKCMLDLFDNNLISYQYRQHEAQLNLSLQEQGWSQIHLLHSNCCPCQNKDLKPLDQNYSKIKLATVAMLCDRDYNFLLTRRHSQMKTFPKSWVFPGGMVEGQQNLESECLREVQEETGLDVLPILSKMELKVMYESIYPTKLEDNQYPIKQTLCMFYEVKINQSYQNVTIKMEENEVDDYKWLSKKQMLEIMNGQTKDHSFLEIAGIYPNSYGSGIGEGHVKAFLHCYA
ncbi:unnamed protein product (macronuclear) [Paramecium tetraurelia]|uniref:m7GpppN-mRNA hydrolase NUDT17 n=1 Tax=Paramecium tetraurelia TaxID=5888 RepID=A0BW67_PARTE|nr:uncharacterized protein GSPATT00032636001 [Paramecium tetraurelia]CAK62784.1 unnamed protein product [Paramecium tetraurelia]|eukprot:XP_001430182.1 hypothetical protein (macronuclear) [Paramecium tetraurelia strain d4-2]